MKHVYYIIAAKVGQNVWFWSFGEWTLLEHGAEPWREREHAELGLRAARERDFTALDQACARAAIIVEFKWED